MSRRTREPEGVDDALEPEDAPEVDDETDADTGDDEFEVDLDAIDLTPTEEEKAAAAAETQERLRQLWEDFKATGDSGLRDKLILHYSPLVKYVAGRVGVGLPPNIEQADLVSYGIFGLIDAIEKFDLDRAIKFETYAINRIRGAIIDELRSIDWIPRSVRFKAREVEKAYQTLEAQLQRTPTEAEVASRWASSSTSCTPSSARCPSSTSWPSTSCSTPAASAATR
ncbi:MAG: sigma-70 family RNA polymerase sigma factor [Candidatus Nanopelagicales bacterium]